MFFLSYRIIMQDILIVKIPPLLFYTYKKLEFYWFFMSKMLQLNCIFKSLFDWVLLLRENEMFSLSVILPKKGGSNNA